MKHVKGKIQRKSMLYVTGVEYGDYTMNHVLGCAHGCKYPCYAYLMKRRFGQVDSYEGWLESEKDIYERFFDQALNASLRKLERYLNMMLPLYSENMVLSKELRNPWDEQTQLAYTYYANLNGSDAKRMSLAIGMGLKNVKNGVGSYDNLGRLNLFAV